MAYRLGKLLLKKVWNTCIQVKVRNRLSYAMRSRTAPIPCPSPPLPAGSPSVHSNGARERTLQGAVTTAWRGDYQMTAGSGRCASHTVQRQRWLSTARLTTYFDVRRKKCVVQTLIIKALMAYSILMDTRKTGVTSTPPSTQLIFVSLID